jgi:hypothetical protein
MSGALGSTLGTGVVRSFEPQAVSANEHATETPVKIVRALIMDSPV